jgi:hypothetical protein
MAKSYRDSRAPSCARASLAALDLLRRVEEAGIDLTVPLPRAADATPPAPAGRAASGSTTAEVIAVPALSLVRTA